MNRPANLALLALVTLTEKPILPAGPRHRLSCAGPGPTAFVPDSPTGRCTLRYRPQGIACKCVSRDKADGDERPRG